MEPGNRSANPSCATCRKRSRKCDRGRPVCRRCVSHGLDCGGYPSKFRFFNVTENLTSRRTRSPKSSRPASRAPPDELAGGDTPAFSAATSSSTTPSTATDQVRIRSPAERVDSITVQDVLHWDHSQELLVHYDRCLCDVLIITQDNIANPFRDYVLPLAYESAGILHAVLSLSARHHSGRSGRDGCSMTSLAEKYSLHATQILDSLLELGHLSHRAQVSILIMALLLILQDMFKGSDITSANLEFLCRTDTFCQKLISQSPVDVCAEFAIAALARIDAVRAFMGNESLSLSKSVREFTYKSQHHRLDRLTGCPDFVLRSVMDSLDHAEKYQAGSLTCETFRMMLSQSRRTLQGWRNPTDADTEDYCNLGTAYQQACIVRISKLLGDVRPQDKADTDESIAIGKMLDAVSQVSQQSTFYKQLLIPLSLVSTGMRTWKPHQQHYAQLCLEEIRRQIGICCHCPLRAL
ncbi:fungal-specific transcription factor domain-containing protein [Exophiala viscosa]|uniref:fungal-specific transcription factor domain-containing protein n=1 Tax=Exophiala viscosa TaxID=2486360 RepID=UPI00219F97BE|nr:fungal-specific transcription factor domain-containing protein [Exophiala viscosa]